MHMLETKFRDALAGEPAEYASLRYVDERHEVLRVRQNVGEPALTWRDTGAMVTVVRGGGLGYAATSDLSAGGVRRAVRRARQWADLSAGRAVADFSAVGWPHSRGECQPVEARAWSSMTLAEKFELLRQQCQRLKTDERIVDWEASLWRTETDSLLLTSGGGRVRQRTGCLVPFLRATANAGSQTQTRTLGGRGYCRQGGLEVLDDVGFERAAPAIAAEALELLAAPDCPSGAMDVLLAPDQMILQIHESIGHPLELDRILGDERNYAGTSFVTLDMLGTYRYGSELLNITYDPTKAGEFASYAFDDDGLPAAKTFLIKGGVLLRALGALASQTRANLPGVANARACSWNRPPIDRMANLNLEPGRGKLEEMIAGIERGVYMKTNCSWSIDDSRNKFQFGCEWGRMIEGGKLAGVVRKPNYRGVSATFWRSLAMVGDESTVELLGSPYCGKGEPNQCVRVGHASPACVFRGVDVFGGE
jgi:predicted Zn-dependent protease